MEAQAPRYRLVPGRDGDNLAISRVDPLGNSAIEYRYLPEFEPTRIQAADHKPDKNNKSMLTRV